MFQLRPACAEMQIQMVDCEDGKDLMKSPIGCRSFGFGPRGSGYRVTSAFPKRREGEQVKCRPERFFREELTPRAWELCEIASYIISRHACRLGVVASVLSLSSKKYSVRLKLILPHIKTNLGSCSQPQVDHQIPTPREGTRIKTMKILITGAGGFVGQLLAEHLLNDNHKVILADIFEPPIPSAAKNQENATPIKADLYETPDAVLSKDLDAIYVFHGIMSAGSEADFDLGYRVNLHSTLNLLEAVRKTCPGVRLIYASSTAIFGQPLPEKPSEATVPTPQGSYGTQKAMIEYLVNDYNRRGFINGITLRFPTISVRPGKPTAAASSWMSGIIREPLQGQESTLPCDDDFKAWLSSPKTLVKNLIHALSLPADAMPNHVRQILLPGITSTVAEMLQALKEVGGEDALRLVKREKPSPEIKAMLDSWPITFDVSEALSLGFVQDDSFKSAVEDFAATLKE